jgi:hypothetical protein
MLSLLCACERVISNEPWPARKETKTGHGAGDSRSSHHPLGLGAVPAQVRSLGQLGDDGGLGVGETEFRELEVGSDGGVVDAEQGEHQSDQDAGACCRWEGGLAAVLSGVAEVECGMKVGGQLGREGDTPFNVAAGVDGVPDRKGGMGGGYTRSFPAEQCTRMGFGEAASASMMVRNGSHWLSGEPAASRMLR